MNFEFPIPVPQIPVSDLAKALKYYETHLGFGIDWAPRVEAT